MPIESLQCPACAAPLQADTSAGLIYCNYCGSRLRVTRGASGRPLGVLEEIRADTGIVAKRAALSHLQERLDGLLGRRQGLTDQAGREVAATVYRGLREGPWSGLGGDLMRPAGQALLALAVLMTVGLFCAMGQTSSSPRKPDEASTLANVLICGVPTAAVWAGGLWLLNRAEARRALIAQLHSRARQRAQETYGEQLSQLDREIEVTKGRMDKLRAELDGLAEEL